MYFDRCVADSKHIAVQGALVLYDTEPRERFLKVFETFLETMPFIPSASAACHLCGATRADQQVHDGGEFERHGLSILSHSCEFECVIANVIMHCIYSAV